MRDPSPQATLAPQLSVARLLKSPAWVLPLVSTVLCACMSERGGGYDVAVAPPPPPVAEAPSPRPGYVWAPGYWSWQSGSHVWVEGHWMPARPGEHWVPDTWTSSHNGHWHFEPGHWAEGDVAALR
jgi:hypothetical protein